MTTQKVRAYLQDDAIITEDSDHAREFYSKQAFGEIKESKVRLSYLEAMYLYEKKKIEMYSASKRKLSTEGFRRKAVRKEPNFSLRYTVFADMRSRGYVIKTALKFGADFRVYDRGVKPGEDHAKWVLYPVHESQTLTWHEFAAKNRVAHSTKKRLMLGIVDDEGSVTYYEIKWSRP